MFGFRCADHARSETDPQVDEIQSYDSARSSPEDKSGQQSEKQIARRLSGSRAGDLQLRNKYVLLVKPLLHRDRDGIGGNAAHGHQEGNGTAGRNRGRHQCVDLIKPGKSGC